MATWYRFTWENIQNAPNQAGVYGLADGQEIIYYGRAKGGDVTIRSRLSDHKKGKDGPCTQNATHYWREKTSQPVSRERELLAAYRAQHGKLPRCNEVMP